VPTGYYSFSFTDQPRSSDEGYPGTLEIDPDGLELTEFSFSEATQCASYEIEWGVRDGEPFAIVTSAELGEATWCWAAVVTKTLPDGFTQSTWFGFGKEDPAKRVS
jgi:hypothetical protein